MFIGVNWLIEADSMTLETARSIPWYPFCLVLEIANLEIAWAKISWIVGSCENSVKNKLVCVECISTWTCSVPTFSQWAKSQIFLGILFACCTSDVFSPFSSSTVVECFSQANNSQPSGSRHSSSESFTSIRSKLPWEKQSIRWATCTESRIISLYGPKSTNLQGTSPWYSLNADQRHAL